MSHIYQPLLIESGGMCTVRQLALAFLNEDESQLKHYESVIKKMPISVLSRREIITKEGELVSLNVKKLSLSERASVLQACEKRLQGFIEQKGIGLWGYRLGETDPVPDSLRYRLLKESGRRCALCGVTEKDRPLDIDHIIPRSKGGSN